MRTLFITLLAALCITPIAARADFGVQDLPDASTWYLHVDFAEMRKGGAADDLYDWLDDEVFEEIHDDVGIDVGREIDNLTAYAAAGAGTVIVLQGDISSSTAEKLLDLANEDGDLETLKSRGKTFYYFEDGGRGIHSRHVDIDSFDDGVYFSFALDDKIILTPSRDQMESLLASNGHIAGSGSHDDALFVLSAERNLVQAGANADQMRGQHDDWDSKLLRNTRQIALLIADVGGKIAIDARLEASEPQMANSLANIARGLIGLASFSDDMEPQIAHLLNSTRIDVKDSVLKISVAMDPDAFVAILED